MDTTDAAIMRVRDLARHDIQGNRLADEHPGFLPTKAIRRLETCGFQLKSAWYRLSRVTELDAAYATLVDQIRTRPRAAPHSYWFEMLSGDQWRYFPFFEAMEFSDLLNTVSGCAESFCQGVGSLFRNEPTRLKGLREVLSAAIPGEPLAGDLLACVCSAEETLHGLVVDPGAPKKALRDLMQHRERAPIHFLGDAESRSAGALVQQDHPLLIRFETALVTHLAHLTWHGCYTFVATGLSVAIRILEQRRKLAASS